MKTIKLLILRLVCSLQMHAQKGVNQFANLHVKRAFTR